MHAKWQRVLVCDEQENKQHVYMNENIKKHIHYKHHINGATTIYYMSIFELKKVPLNIQSFCFICKIGIHV